MGRQRQQNGGVEDERAGRRTDVAVAVGDAHRVHGEPQRREEGAPPDDDPLTLDQRDDGEGDRAGHEPGRAEDARVHLVRRDDVAGDQRVRRGGDEHVREQDDEPPFGRTGGRRGVRGDGHDVQLRLDGAPLTTRCRGEWGSHGVSVRARPCVVGISGALLDLEHRVGDEPVRPGGARAVAASAEGASTRQNTLPCSSSTQ